MKALIKIQFAATLAAALSVVPLARGQSSEALGEADGGPPSGAATASAMANAPADPRSMPPAAAAFFYYFEIQEALAQDSLTNVAANAVALAGVLRKDPTGGFPAQLPDQALALARGAVTLAGARLDFAILTGQLMTYLQARKPPTGLGPIHLVHDPTHSRLYWLQRGDLVQNPYLGKAGVPWRPLIPPTVPGQPVKLGGS